VEYKRRAETFRKAAAGPVNPALNLSKKADEASEQMKLVMDIARNLGLELTG
jgi:hypothetical protein